MKSTALQYFSNQLDELALHVHNMDSAMFKNEVNILAHRVLLEIGRTVDMEQMCDLLIINNFPTFGGLREAIRAIEIDYKRRKPARAHSGDALQADLQRLIAEIHSDITVLETARSDVDTTVHPQRILGLQIEPRLQALLEGYCKMNLVPRSLRACLRRRLLMLGERTIHALWNSIKEEIREQREADNRRLEPDEFGQFPDLDLACAKIVAHMTTPKPERPLRIARIIERKELPPLDLVPGLAIILTWGDQQAADHPTLEQQMFAANLQRLIFPLRKLTNATTRDVLGLLGVRSLRPLEATKHHFSDDDITPAAQQVFYILRSLMWDAHCVTASKVIPKRLLARRNTQRNRPQCKQRGPRRRSQPANRPLDAVWMVEVDAKSGNRNGSSLELGLKIRLGKLKSAD